jgi:predicted dehydrogenase
MAALTPTAKKIPMTRSRRDFLRTSGFALAGFGAAPALLRGIATVPANDRLRVGVIGCNGMGFSDLRSMMRRPEVDCIAICDVDRSVRERRHRDLEVNRPGTKRELYSDYRALLENDDIDAVIIGTPDHWHCLPMVEACSAGKDVYVEKPLANTIEECHVMTMAAARYGRIVQVGQWQRSGAHWREALEFVQSGQLGRIRLVKAWAYMDWMKEIPVRADEPVPEGVDYDRWLGPAPSRPYNRNRFHFNFRWYWDYAGGLMTDWGVHLIDMVLAGMKVEAPVSVLSNGGKFAYPNDAMETPDTQQAIYDYGDFTMMWEHAVGIGLGPFQRSHGVAFIGNLGTLVVDRAGWEVLAEIEYTNQTQKMSPVPKKAISPELSGLNQHTENFVDCVKSRAQPTCPSEIGGLAAINAHLGNIAFKTGRKLDWDAKSASFGDDPEANALLKATYRAPWKLPEV